MDNRGLLFIPDISGFTRFVTETEIDHSRRIVQELVWRISSMPTVKPASRASRANPTVEVLGARESVLTRRDFPVHRLREHARQDVEEGPNRRHWNIRE
jgi:hypothetical protein